MGRSVNWKSIRSWISAALLALAFLNVLFQYSNQKHRPVYGDEAETVLLALSTLENGYPRVTNPSTYFSNMRGADFGIGGIDTLHGWIQHYAAAAVIGLSGSEDYRVVRALFFALAIAGLGLVFISIQRISGSGIAAAFLVFSVSLNSVLVWHLLQIRYYGLAFFAASLLLASFVLKGPKIPWILVSLLSLLYIQFLQALAIVAAYVALVIFSRLRSDENGYGKNAVGQISVLAAAIAPLVFICVLPTLAKTHIDLSIVERMRINVFSERILTVEKIFPGIFVASLIALIAAVVKRERTVLFWFCISSIAFLILSAGQSHTYFRYRYLVIIGPFFLLALGFLHKWFDRNSLRSVWWISMAVCAFLNYQQFNPNSWKDNGYTLSITWLDENLPKGSTIYANFDRRDIILNTELKVVKASDLEAIEFGRVVKPLALESDPTNMDIDKVDYIFWNKVSERLARGGSDWLIPEYTTVYSVPDNFVPVFENTSVAIYSNSALIEAEANPL